MLMVVHKYQNIDYKFSLSGTLLISAEKARETNLFTVVEEWQDEA